MLTRDGGLSEDQIQTAFRKSPHCMLVSVKKITAVMDFLVSEMGSIVENPLILNSSLKKRIIPRCSIIRILVSNGLIKKTISLSSLSVMVDKYFLDKFVKPYEQEFPELIEVFQGQSSYQDILLQQRI